MREYLTEKLERIEGALRLNAERRLELVAERGVIREALAHLDAAPAALPLRDQIAAYLHELGQPAHRTQIAQALGVSPQQVSDHIRALVEEGSVIRPSRGSYAAVVAA